MKRVLFLLGHLNDLDVEWLITNGQAHDLKPNERLITMGIPVEQLYIVLSGELKIVGNDDLYISTISNGEMVGEMSFLESQAPSVSVIASETSTVFAVSRELVTDRLANNLEFRANFYYAISLFLSNRLRKTTSQLGYGNPQEEDALDERVLDGVSQAGSRFTEILQKFSAV